MDYFDLISLIIGCWLKCCTRRSHHRTTEITTGSRTARERQNNAAFQGSRRDPIVTYRLEGGWLGGGWIEQESEGICPRIEDGEREAPLSCGSTWVCGMTVPEMTRAWHREDQSGNLTTDMASDTSRLPGSPTLIGDVASNLNQKLYCGLIVALC